MAKPANWKRMSWDKKFDHASKLWASDRSEHLVAHALDIAILEMKKQRGARRQTSDIEDMEMLREMIIGSQRLSDSPKRRGDRTPSRD